MASIAKTVASRGGKVLNVGYGIGFIDAEIERLREQGYCTAVCYGAQEAQQCIMAYLSLEVQRA
jgi:5-formyltetrahydrofolate cyclo-ligase